MAKAQSKGNCYLCGAEMGKTAMKNHILKEHSVPGEQECYLIKVEGMHDKNYWLLLEMSKAGSMNALDGFLRKIWLECCGHLSAFFDAWGGQFGKTQKIGKLEVGDQLRHEYDFGTTTETLITVLAETTRPKQREVVRLLARNIPQEFKCADCGKPATGICQECMWESDTPFYCDACHTEHREDEMVLPITNSPRMGECGYDGELDTYAFDPAAIRK